MGAGGVPFTYKGKRVLSVWVSDDLYEALVDIADSLGYSSLSAFVNDVLREVVAAASLTKNTGNSELRRKLTLHSLFEILTTKFRIK